MRYYSPLRYPGGKRKLADYIKLVFHENNLMDGDYAEPYAGGAGVALALLFDEYARRIHINDLDPGISAFWFSAVHDTEALCELIRNTPVSMHEWHKQKEVQADSNSGLLELGFATFFLNRTNRSGIISGGVIGGKQQNGKWSLDARFNKEDLIRRIQKIGRFRNRISVYDLDAKVFLQRIVPQLPERSLVYLDPPYYIKGQQLLYTNYYKPEDHAGIAALVNNMECKWIVSYDNVPEISQLYEGLPNRDYDISYSAQERYAGSEMMFFNPDLRLPVVDDPVRVPKSAFIEYA